MHGTREHDDVIAEKTPKGSSPTRAGRREWRAEASGSFCRT